MRQLLALARSLRTGPVELITLPSLAPTPEALVFRGVAKGFERVAVPGVSLAAGELVVEIELATICGSDRHTATGKRHEDAPLVLGHEQVGRIVAIGPGDAPQTVDGQYLQLGDRVVWGVAVSCGECHRCRSGLSNKCERLRKYGHTRIDRGWELNGGFATHAHVLAGSDIVRVPEELPAEVLAPASCATATVVAAFDAVHRPLAGEAVLVSGCGMLGLTAIAMARAAGAVVVGVDPDATRRKQAREFGAAATCSPGPVKLRAALARAVDDHPKLEDTTGFAAAFEMSGANDAISSLIDAADVGGTIVLVGSVFPAPPAEIVAEQIVRKLLTITGVHNYRGEHLLRAVEFLLGASHRRFASLVSQNVSLADAATELCAPSSRAARIGVRPGLPTSD